MNRCENRFHGVVVGTFKEREGYRAKGEGKAREANPYEPGTCYHEQWDTGWAEAAYGAGDGVAS